MSEKKRSHRIGRPPAITPEVLRQLDTAFSLGCTDREAALYAGIGSETLYSYLRKHPDYAERREALKDRPVLMARKASCDLLEEGDPVHVRWYLERRRREEFTAGHALEVSGSGSLTIEDKATALHDLLVAFTGPESAPEAGKDQDEGIV